MKNNNIKVILILLTLFMLVFTGYQIKGIYGLFHSELYGTASLELGRWSIKLNTTQISTTTTQEFVIDNLNTSSTSTIKEGKFGPGITGYFDITIDATDSDVSARYDLTIDTSSITNNQINMTSIIETEENNLITHTATNTYTAILPLTGEQLNTIRIAFEWVNEETNNENDTLLGTGRNATIEIPITVIVSQYLGEEIIRNLKRGEQCQNI